jgi:hypothetical protein
MAFRMRRLYTEPHAAVLVVAGFPPLPYRPGVAVLKEQEQSREAGGGRTPNIHARCSRAPLGQVSDRAGKP